MNKKTINYKTKTAHHYIGNLRLLSKNNAFAIVIILIKATLQNLKLFFCN